MVRPANGKKSTIICIAIYVSIIVGVFVILSYILPDAIEYQRELLKHAMSKMSNFTNMTLENGGTPIRSILVTFKGSGALKLLNTLTNHPGSFHHYAPLLAFEKPIDKDTVKAAEALGFLEELLNCDYRHAYQMLQYGKQITSFRRFYGHQAELIPRFSQQICWNPEIFTQSCKIYPFINMSIYLLRLHHVAMLLENDKLNVRIMLLVRDPRGTMQSRRQRVWCTGRPDCEDPKFLCEQLVEDYETAEKLLKRFPSRFATLRYEDLALNPYDVTQEILQFYHLPLDPAKEDFMDKEIKVNIGDASSMYRDSRTSPYHWMDILPVKEIKQIQNVCGKAMELWGYRKIENFTMFQDAFEPLILPPPSLGIKWLKKLYTQKNFKHHGQDIQN